MERSRQPRLRLTAADRLLWVSFSRIWSEWLFPYDDGPAYLLHDRDSAFAGIASTLAAMQIQELVTAPRSPWQNGRASSDRFGANASIM